MCFVGYIFVYLLRVYMYVLNIKSGLKVLLLVLMSVFVFNVSVDIVIFGICVIYFELVKDVMVLMDNCGIWFLLV